MTEYPVHRSDAAVVPAFRVAGLRGKQGIECSEGSKDLFRILSAAEAYGFPAIESGQCTRPFFDLHFQCASIRGHGVESPGSRAKKGREPRVEKWNRHEIWTKAPQKSTSNGVFDLRLPLPSKGLIRWPSDMQLRRLPWVAWQAR